MDSIEIVVFHFMDCVGLDMRLSFILSFFLLFGYSIFMKTIYLSVYSLLWAGGKIFCHLTYADELEIQFHNLHIPLYVC